MLLNISSKSRLSVDFIVFRGLFSNFDLISAPCRGVNRKCFNYDNIWFYRKGPTSELGKAVVELNL